MKYILVNNLRSRCWLEMNLMEHLECLFSFRNRGSNDSADD